MKAIVYIVPRSLTFCNHVFSCSAEILFEYASVLQFSLVSLLICQMTTSLAVFRKALNGEELAWPLWIISLKLSWLFVFHLGIKRLTLRDRESTLLLAIQRTVRTCRDHPPIFLGLSRAGNAVIRVHTRRLDSWQLESNLNRSCGLCFRPYKVEVRIAHIRPLFLRIGVKYCLLVNHIIERLSTVCRTCWYEKGVFHFVVILSEHFVGKRESRRRKPHTQDPFLVVMFDILIYLNIHCCLLPYERF